jgi:hypothetical protein
MNPRPNLELSPDKEALKEAQKLVKEALGKDSELTPEQKEPWKYVKNVCEFFNNKDRRTWRASLMLSSAVIAARFERHSEDKGGENGFNHYLAGDELYNFDKLIYPAAKHGFDYAHHDDYHGARPGLQSEFVHVEHLGPCPSESVSYTADGVNSLLVKFVMPKVREGVKGYTHRAHIVRVDYANPHNLHVLYNKLTQNRLSTNECVVTLLDNFYEQYLRVRQEEKLIKVVILMYTQFHYKNNSKIVPKSVFVINPSRRNTDHVRIPIEEKKGEHGALSADLANDVYKDVAIRIFDTRMAIGVVTGHDGKEYLGYPDPVEDIPEEPEEDKVCEERIGNSLVRITTEKPEKEYIKELDKTIKDTLSDIRKAIKVYNKKIAESAESRNFDRVARISKEAQQLVIRESQLIRSSNDLYIQLEATKQAIQKANTFV